jgi:hypothetical protein
MILANVRSRLRAADLRLVVLALSRGDPARRGRYERLLAEAGPAALEDRELADYLAALLLGFGDHDRHARVRRHDDESYDYLVDILADLAEQDEAGERGFLLQTHLGNYSLWLAGLFPDYVAARRHRTGGPDLPYYDELGRHGYDLASRHRMARDSGMAGIFRAAADRFPALRAAFNRLMNRTTTGREPWSAILRCMIPATGPSCLRMTSFQRL